MAKKAAAIRPEMQGKALCFVAGTMRPAVAPLNAGYVLKHADGSPMLAESTSDTVEECRARFAEQANGTSTKSQSAKEKAAAEKAEAERLAAGKAEEEEAELQRLLAEEEAAAQANAADGDGQANTEEPDPNAE